MIDSIAFACFVCVFCLRLRVLFSVWIQGVDSFVPWYFCKFHSVSCASDFRPRYFASRHVTSHHVLLTPTKTNVPLVRYVPYAYCIYIYIYISLQCKKSIAKCGSASEAPLSLLLLRTQSFEQTFARATNCLARRSQKRSYWHRRRGKKRIANNSKSDA